MADLETHDIQGIVLSGYVHLKHSSYLFLHFDDAAEGKKWLAEIIKDITSAKYPTGPGGKPKKPEWALNIAFTSDGIAALGYPVDTFSQEFREGITFDGRPKRLGDTDLNDPAQWEVGASTAQAQDKIHVCLMIQTTTEPELLEKCSAHRKLLTAHRLREVATAEHGYLPDDGVEHFGFADAISEPDLVGSPKRIKDEQSCVQPGEFVLGYNNEYGMLPATPTVDPALDTYNNLKPEPHADDSTTSRPTNLKDLGRNGSYMVFRKLHQDVAGWRRYFVENFPDEIDLMQAKFIGRWHSGAPLVLYPDKEPFADTSQGEGRVNDFCYAKLDPGGLRCPVGAHIRRVNPRDSLEDDPAESIRSVNRHRLLRRGAIYGAKLEPGATQDDGVGRGVLFLGLNCDLKRQFEFIQQTWINRPKFSGLYDERDPVLATQSDNSGLNNMTIQRDPVRQRITGLPQFVMVKGGAYLFLPGIAALSFLAGIKNPRPNR